MRQNLLLPTVLLLSLAAGCGGAKRPPAEDPRDAQLRDANRQIAELQSRESALGSEVQGAQEQLAASRREASALEQSLARTRESLSSAERQHQQAVEAGAALRSDNESLARRAGALSARSDRMMRQLAARGGELADRDERLGRLQRELSAQHSLQRSLESRVAGLQDERSDLQTRLAALGASKRTWIVVSVVLLLLLLVLPLAAYRAGRGQPERSDRVHLRMTG
jgi:chromosome segregation ATPase